MLISAESEPFVSAVEAAISRPYLRVITFDKGSAEQRLDIYPEERLAALIAMTDDLRSDRLLVLVPSVVESVLARWDETTPGFEDTGSILRSMEEETWTKARLDPALYERLRARMLAELANACSFYDFMQVQEFLRTTAVGATDAEIEAFSSSYYSYIRSQFAQDLRETQSSGDALEDMATFMSEMLNDGYDITWEYGRVMEAKEQRDEHAERRADHDYDNWKDQRGFERSDEEAISSMFDSLR